MEPYERSAWYVTIVLLIAFLVAMAMGANPATAFGYMFGVLMLVWVSPLFVERIKAKTANHHHVGNIGIKPCFNPKPLAATSDDPDTGPGLMLFTFGGGGGSGFHLKDGGTGFNSGGYFIEPIDAIIEHDGGLTAHPCIFQEVTFDSIIPQFQATIMENGYHNTNTIIYQAIVHLASIKPPSMKMLNEEAIMTMKDNVAAQSRTAASDIMGQTASQMDLIREIVNTQKPISKRVRKAVGMERDEEEGPNGP